MNKKRRQAQQHKTAVMNPLRVTTQRIDALMRRFDIDVSRARSIIAVFERSRMVPFATPLLGIAIDAARNVYYYNKQLGEGATGEVYSASRDGSAQQQFVVKEFSLEQTDSEGNPLAYDLRVWHVEKEFAVGRVIRRRLSEGVCEEHIVCPLDRFYSADHTKGYLIFPFSGSRTLAVFLTSYLYVRMRTYREQLEQGGLGTQTAETLQQLTHGVGSTAELAQQALRELRDIQLIAIQLVRQIVMAVALLHYAHVIHQDLKPENMLVDDILLRIIDFGIACVMPRDSDELFEESEQRFFSCPDVYETTPDYEDPLAQYLRAEDLLQQLVLFARFDTYAVGKVLQTIFDPTIYDDSGHRRRFPVVERTEFMLPGIYELIVSMTGEENYSPPFGNDPARVYELRLPEREFNRRLALLDTRPDMNTVSQTVSHIINEWAARLSLIGTGTGTANSAGKMAPKRRRVQRSPPLARLAD